MQSLVKDTVYPLGFERVKKNDVKGSHADSVYDTKTLIVSGSRKRDLMAQIKKN